MPWLVWLVPGLSPWSPCFESSSIHVRFVVDKLTFSQGFLQELWFSPVSSIQQMFTVIHLFVADAIKSQQLTPLLNNRVKNYLGKNSFATCYTCIACKGHTQKNGAVVIVFTIKIAPFFCVCPVLLKVYDLNFLYFRNLFIYN